MKMKLKNRTKIVLISAVLICLFLNSFIASALTTSSVTCPSTVKVGSTFEVDIGFNYLYSSDCLYGNSIWLLYVVGVDPDFFGNYVTIAIPINDLDEFPRPANVTVEIDTSTIVCAVNDTFLFRIKWINGVKHDGTVLKSATSYSGFYEITITATKRPDSTSISPLSVVIPVLLLSAIVLIRKKK